MCVAGSKRHLLRKGQSDIALAKVTFSPKVFEVEESNGEISFFKFGTEFFHEKRPFFKKKRVLSSSYVYLKCVRVFTSNTNMQRLRHETITQRGREESEW